MRSAILAALLLVSFSSVAQAATVGVVETPGYVNKAELNFAAGGADDSVVVAIAGEEGDYLKLNVVDEAGGLVPGSMCADGGGPGGTSAICMLRKPRAQEFMVFGGKVFVPTSGTGWEDSFSVDLGEGTNRFDAGGLGGERDKGIEMTVTAGAGADSIVTGGGDDTIDPGSGRDEVHGGAGYDRVIATPAADGEDLYDLGPEIGKVDYSRRSQPVLLDGHRVGAADELDLLIAGSPYVVGGAGDDRMTGSDGQEILEGNGGDDVLSGKDGDDELAGGRGNDLLYGEEGADTVVGEPGDDVLDGAEGNDVLWDLKARIEPGGYAILPPPGRPSGNDAALGGDGRDVINLGAGADRGVGGSGNDRIQGLRGSDRIRGGAGSDQLDCGLGRDRALVDRRDRTDSCEVIRLAGART